MNCFIMNTVQVVNGPGSRVVLGAPKRPKPPPAPNSAMAAPGVPASNPRQRRMGNPSLALRSAGANASTPPVAPRQQLKHEAKCDGRPKLIRGDRVCAVLQKLALDARCTMARRAA